jgi:hypothetical protein
MATNLRPEVWGMDEDEEIDDDELYEEGQWEDMLEEYRAEDEADDGDTCEAIQGDEDEIATCFAVVMGVAFPERIPELFPKTVENPFPGDQRDPKFEATLIAMLPEAVEILREDASTAREKMSELGELGN